MRVLLHTDIPNLGKAGELKEVKDGYARNYLLPRRLAVPASLENIAKQEKALRLIEKAKEQELHQVRSLAGRLRTITLTFLEKSTPEGHLYGGIHREDIVLKLKEQGIMIEPKSVILNAPIKTIGSHQVEIHLNFGVKTKVEVKIIFNNVIPANAGNQKQK